MLTEEDKVRRSRLRQCVHDHLLETERLVLVEGMALDSNWLEGSLLSWTWNVKLKTGDVIIYSTLNEDGAPVLADGEEIQCLFD